MKSEKIELDFIDENKKFIDFTQKNIDLICFCVSVDSSYRNAFNAEYLGSTAELITKHWKFNREYLTRLCEQISKENSTHLAVSGNKKNDKNTDNGNIETNKGVELVVDKILSIEDFENKLESANLDLVNEIAGCVAGVSKFSFASKFCSYVSRYRFKNNNAYSIYDKVISEILPYYEWAFLHTTNYVRQKRNKTKDNVSTIADIFAKKGSFDYAGYNELINEIIQAINTERNLEIDRTIFDRVLWYYYKGDAQLRQDALNTIQINCERKENS